LKRAYLLILVLVLCLACSGASAGPKSDTPLTRAQLCQMLVENLGLEPYLPDSAGYSDVPLDHWAAPFIYAATRAKLVRGYPDGKFLPDGGVTRAEFCLLLYRALKTPPYHLPETPSYSDVPSDHWAYVAIEYLTGAGIVKGYPDGTFRPNTPMLRSDAAAAFARAFGSDKDGTTLQEGVIKYSEDHYLEGQPIPLGFDPYGYNYQAHLFRGSYANVYLGRDGFPPYDGNDASYLASLTPDQAAEVQTRDDWPYRNDQLVMKWNDAWLSNRDRDGDGKLDRHHGFTSYIGSGAWETNHLTYTEDGQQYVSFCKIIAVPEGAVKDPPSGEDDYTYVWRTPEGVEIGPGIWGAFAVVLETESGSGVLYRSPAGPGFGKW